MRSLASLQAAITMFALVALSSPLMVVAQEVTPPSAEEQTTQEQSSEEESSDDESAEEEEVEDVEEEEEVEKTGDIVSEILGAFSIQKKDKKEDEDKIEICHTIPAKWQVLEVSESAWNDEGETGHGGHENDFVIEDEADEDFCEASKIRVVKEVVGGEASPEDFSFTVFETEEGDNSSDSEDYEFDVDGEVFVSVDDDEDKTYTVVEDAVEDYVASYEDCEDISFKKEGDIETCTITNTYVPPEPQSCEIVSNTVDFVLEKNDNAVLTWVHGAWADLLTGASWVWGDYEVVDPSSNETQTFVKEFVVTGTADSALLRLAADNGALVKINGTTVLDQLTGLDLGDQNYNDPADLVDILAYVVSGTNTIEITVTNLAYNTQDPHTNPAGLIYKIEIEGTDCDEQEYVPEPDAETATLHATKIVCPLETSLPNWGAGNVVDAITSTTATAFLATHPECSVQAGWEFQWATDAAGDPEDNGSVALGSPWETFTTGLDGSVMTEVPAGINLRVREVLKSGYVPFTGQNTDQNVSAEMYCGPDVVNYDNWEWINATQENANYYCVAFNAPVAEQCEVEAETVLLSSDADGGGLLTDDEIGPASVVAWLHAAWLQEVGEWIWKDTSTSADDAAGGAEETFTRTFTVIGTPKDSILEIAADNQYEIYVNGDLLVADTGEFNYGATEEHVIPASMLQGGENSIMFVIDNIDHPTENTPETNPAGLLYKVTVNEDECDPYEPPVPTKATVSATKIMCEAEEFLPNMAGGADITSTTASAWLAEGDNAEHCWLEEGYVFQWAPNGTPDPADNGTEALGSPWTSFAPTGVNGVATAEITVADAVGVIQVREVLKTGDQEFTGDNNDVSAELFCSSDVAGYDNWEWISDPAAGETYHCVAFNANEDAENPDGGGGNDPEGTLVVRKYTEGGNGIFSFYVEEEVDFASVVVLDPDVVVDTGDDGYGEESLVLPVGEYSISEIVPEGWDLTSASCGQLNVGTASEGASFVIEEDETTYCDFYNETVSESITPSVQNGGGGGGPVKRTSDSNDEDEDGIVAGVSDEQCGPLLSEYLGKSYANTSGEVTKLQQFLNGEVGSTLPLTGVFGPMTEAAVRTFQLKYWEDVLQPWFAFPEYGVLDADDSTGIVYKTTKWKINNIFCENSEAAPVLP